VTWLLGVDGGGSKTVAQVARLTSDGELHVRGSGSAGPSNIRAVGTEQALANLDRAIDAALAAAERGGKSCDIAVLALAGSSLPDVRQQLGAWASARRLAADIEIVHDADAVLAMLPTASAGVALILGTGSAAIGRDAEGRQSVVGGWGHLIGDFGSAFDIGRRGLIAVTAVVDGIGPQTALLPALLENLGVDEPRELVRKLGFATEAKQRIALLAPLVLANSAAGDSVAGQIVDECAAAAADLVLAAIQKLDIAGLPGLALAGGAVCNSRSYRAAVLEKLGASGQHFDPVVVVDTPVDGTLRIARDKAAKA
tara:strand:+ start:3630 stop:4565 length:936 start_codon:yes stop_codon:yes gene_type:complete